MLLVPPSDVVTVATKVLLALISLDGDPFFRKPATDACAWNGELRSPVSMPWNAGIKAARFMQTNHANRTARSGFL
jgi:hypothetical protein